MSVLQDGYVIQYCSTNLVTVPASGSAAVRVVEENTERIALLLGAAGVNDIFAAPFGGILGSASVPALYRIRDTALEVYFGKYGKLVQLPWYAVAASGVGSAVVAVTEVIVRQELAMKYAPVVRRRPAIVRGE